MDSCLSDGLTEGRRVHYLASAISGSDPYGFFVWGFVKDEFYVPPLSITLNNVKD
jgi:hypothetical protein